jgi:hypothetical protein
MDNGNRSTGKFKLPIFWITRVLSIVVVGIFSFFLFLAFTNEDKPEGMEFFVYIPLVVAILGCLLAWRWQKVGGVITVIAAVILSTISFLVTMEFGGYVGAALVALIYGLPFLLVGVLFLITIKAVHQGK